MTFGESEHAAGTGGGTEMVAAGTPATDGPGTGATLDAGAATWGGRRSLAMTFRVTATLAALSAFAQPFLAGAFLSGHFGALGAHAANAAIASVLALLMTVSGILVWRPGRGAWWPAAVSAGIVLAEGAQTGLGYARVLSLHVPLGVATIAAFAVLLLRVWRPDGAR